MPRAALRIQDKIDKGWRKEAGKLGQLWDVERNNSVVLTNQNYILQRWESPLDIETDLVSFAYKVRGSRRLLQINDILVGKEAASKRQNTTVGERYTIISMRLMRDTIAVRSNLKVRILRPNQPTLSGDQPPQYAIQNPLVNGDILVRRISDNVWLFVDPDVVGLSDEELLLAGYDPTIWAGVTFGRAAEYAPFIQHFEDVPMDTGNTGWVVSCRVFGSIVLRENDYVVTENGDWFRVDRPYEQRDSAFLNQLRCTKLRV